MRTLKRLAETMIKTLNPSRDRRGQAQPVQVREGELACRCLRKGRDFRAQPVQVREGERFFNARAQSNIDGATRTGAGRGTKQRGSNDN